MKKISKLLLKLTLGIAIIAFLGWILYVIDNEEFDGRYKVHYFSTCDCSYKVSNDYKIVFSKKENKYAILCADDIYGGLSDKYYLQKGRYGVIEPTSLSIAKPVMLIDSCDAKAFLKEYLESKEPKVEDLK